MVSGYRIAGDGRWYWAALLREDPPLLYVTDWQSPALQPLLVKSAGLWAEHTCDAPMEQWTVANETYAAALDTPRRRSGQAYGVTTALSWDLEWYATPPAVLNGLRPAHGYQQAGVVHGRIEIGGPTPSTSSRRPPTVGTDG